MGKTTEYKLGVGLDIGTMNIVSARKTSTGATTTKRIRDAFLDLDADAKRSLKMSKVNYIEQDGSLIVIGDSALTMANLFKREARRPLSRGVISAGELDAQAVLGILIHNVLDDPQEEGEHCFYSVPASPIDEPGQDVIFHTEIFRKIIRDKGYTAHPMNEAMAIVFSECAEESFSGLSVSFGAGMANIALAYQANKGMEFSLARCLAADTTVLTEQGPKAISEIKAGEHRVFDGEGQWASVLEVVNNGPRDSLLEVQLQGMSAFPLRMTPDHKVFVKSRFGWDWAEARTLNEGSVVGVPTVQSTQTSGGSYYFGRKNEQNVTVATARNLGRFLGMFLGDGSCGGSTSTGPAYVQLAFNADSPGLIEKYVEVLQTLFAGFAHSMGGFGVQVDPSSEGVVRIKLHSAVVAGHLKERFYTEEGCKILPLPVHKISNQMALGLLEGLFDSDGWTEPKRRTFGNTSLPLIALVHQLLNRFGIRHEIVKRPPRQGGVNNRGVQIKGTKDEYNVRVAGHVSTTLLGELLRVEGHQVWDQFPQFVEYTVSRVSTVPYAGDVYDLKVDSPHHSFSIFGMLVHNCGDWIDAQAARAVGKTASQMCAIKEKGINLNSPNGRDEQALVLYIRSLIEYTLQNIAAQFRKMANDIQLPDPIPFVVSGGTTRATGFMDIFQEEFDRVKKKFPIQISEIRQAGDPMTAVAEGMLVLASEEHGD